jgi:predicted flap endonuclease-1-like 5' DNA nuclease
MDRFKLNPDVPGPVSLERVRIDRDTILTGEKWRKWTKAQFPGQVPKLVLTDSGAMPSKAEPTGPKPRKLKSGVPSGGHVVLSTGSKPKVAEPKPPKVPRPRPAPPPKPVVEEEEEDYGDETDLTVLEGVGPSRMDSLNEAGYETVGEVAVVTATKLIGDLREVKCRISMASAQKIVKSARRYRG